MRRRPASAVTLVEEFEQKRTPLSEYLIDMPVGSLHGVKGPDDMLPGNVLMEKVAHGVHENHAWLFPVERLQQAFGPDRDVKTVFEGMAPHAAESLGEPCSIAVVASGADLGAAGDRVPGGICPF